MSEGWSVQFDNLERRMAVAAIFLNNLVQRDIDLPEEAFSHAEAALKDLSHQGAHLATLRRKCNEAVTADQYMQQAGAQRIWNGTEKATEQILAIQKTLVDAYDQGRIELVSRSEIERSKGAPLSF